MKEKIGKLIELLNEYEKESNLKSEIFGEKSEFIVISKKFGFIKWLVENDKIDFDKTNKKFGELKGFDYLSMYSGRNEEPLLMILSIQDNPIEFLISILK